jgi:hypothetical protein
MSQSVVQLTALYAGLCGWSKSTCMNSRKNGREYAPGMYSSHPFLDEGHIEITRATTSQCFERERHHEVRRCRTIAARKPYAILLLQVRLNLLSAYDWYCAQYPRRTRTKYACNAMLGSAICELRNAKMGREIKPRGNGIRSGVIMKRSFITSHGIREPSL